MDPPPAFRGSACPTSDQVEYSGLTWKVVEIDPYVKGLIASKIIARCD